MKREPIYKKNDVIVSDNIPYVVEEIEYHDILKRYKYHCRKTYTGKGKKKKGAIREWFFENQIWKKVGVKG